jgi:outer membrane immunogenic protein
MKNVIAGATALILMSAPVAAADLAMVTKAPPLATVYNWTGFYAGIHAGYGWGSESVNFTPDAFYAPIFAAGAAPLSGAANPRGALGGVHVGWNWQFNRMVLGVEADISFTDIKAAQTVTGVFTGIPFTGSISQRLSWLSTARLRGGFLVTDNVLLYATGGLAGGHVEASSSSAPTIAGGCLIPGACPSGSSAETRVGWALGGGLEYGVGPWQFRAEYLHYDLGTLTGIGRDPLLPAAGIAASTRFSGEIVRGGISYRF